jgi:hypothetical protein
MKLTIQIVSFKALRSNTLRGFVDIIIPELHLRIYDCAAHSSHGKRWICLPAKPQITREGAARRDPHTGKVAYSPVLEFTGKATRDAFSQRVITALLETFPHAFDDDEVAAMSIADHFAVTASRRLRSPTSSK